MEENVTELYKYIQQKYLWQFYSRSWDRENNINGILSATEELLITSKCSLGDSLTDKHYYSEAKIVVKDIKRDLKFIEGLNEKGIKELIDKVKEKLIGVTVTNTLNGELNVKFY
ncbi:Fe-only/vanadium nitrogenase subunit delta [Clostridium sp. BL-8]|uniref:Fe-only/vanadium nitrogenase subunit delta n=1 Tax=Clostridium sp. BL-8 TaxID=349938 RepID=UPI00098C0898|nr:Fe-only/vanadium nitrogenase subunit delta [Clostridium sp. BL-8]OOM79517.1 nitrogenase vanadium-iron protein delta chain [Clostridium sp. BL-8]